MSASEAISEYLSSNLFITTEEARGLGVNKMALSRLVDDENLFRIGRGVYTDELDWLTDDLKKYIVPCAKYPGAVIAGISALSYHDLTDQEERKTWVAVKKPNMVINPKYKTLRLSGLCYSLGIDKHEFGNRKVLIYDMEKTVVDAFKYFDNEVAFKALKGYLKRKDSNVDKLCDYGKKLRKPLDEYIIAIQAEE